MMTFTERYEASPFLEITYSTNEQACKYSIQLHNKKSNLELHNFQKKKKKSLLHKNINVKIFIRDG